MTSAPFTISDTTSVLRPASLARPVEDSRERLRLRLKPKAPTTGWVDGGWWPRSRDLAAELPGLLSVLAVRMGRIEREASAPTAHEVLMAAGRRGNTDDIDTLLRSRPIATEVLSSTDGRSARRAPSW